MLFTPNPPAYLQDRLSRSYEFRPSALRGDRLPVAHLPTARLQRPLSLLEPKQHGYLKEIADVEALLAVIRRKTMSHVLGRRQFNIHLAGAVCQIQAHYIEWIEVGEDAESRVRSIHFEPGLSHANIRISGVICPPG